MRIQESLPGQNKDSTKCIAPGCHANTRETKPYCSKHIEHAPYIQDLITELERRDSEVAQLKRGRKIPPNAHLISEALVYLREGSVTAANLSRLMGLKIDVIDTLIASLKKAKLVTTSKLQRGGRALHLRPGATAQKAAS